MKKILKGISRVLFSLLLIVSIFGTVNVLAEEVIFKITKIEVKEKSDKVTVNDVSISGGTINNDIVFNDKDDYIKYDISFKNNTEDKYKILSITDDNDSEYLDYTYDNLSNVELSAGEEKTFNLTITYKKETSSLTITDKSVSLTLTYEKEDGTTGTETITNDNSNETNTLTTSNGEVKGSTKNITNPKTGDNVTIYIILGIISLVGLIITTVRKKHFSKSLMAIALASSIALPLGVKADSNKYQLVFINNITTTYNTITLNANGGKFSDNSTEKQFRYKVLSGPTNVYYSHTKNLDDTGKQLSNYIDDADSSYITGTNRGDESKPHTIKIDGAQQLIVDIYYNGEDIDYDGAFVVEGYHPDLYDYDYSQMQNLNFYVYGDEQQDTYTLNGNTLTNMGHDVLVINGDSVTFDFYSDEDICGDGYGYYAIVRAADSRVLLDNMEIPNSPGSNASFAGFYDNSLGIGEMFNLNDLNGDITLYANWRYLYRIISGDFDTVGSEVCIFNECFYVIGKEDDTHVKLLSKYNLKVGSAAGNDATNRQTITSKLHSDGFVSVYPVNFLSYWTLEINMGYLNNATGEYDTYNLPNNAVRPYVNNYVDYLSTAGVNVSGRLLSIYELRELLQNDDMQEHICDESFWLLENVRGNNFGQAFFNGSFETFGYPKDDTNYGVRPVIILEVNA